MQLIKTIAELRHLLKAERQAGKSIGLVPTMGFLHHGHLQLVKASQQKCAATVVSIFVNPTQFGPNEDLALYPRDLQRDLALLEAQGVDYVFAPEVIEMYPDGTGKTATYVEVDGLSSVLMGALRPGHFRGVATVVSKLFNIVQPDRAFFGEKDFQQLAVIRQMTKDLDQPVEVTGVPTVREQDGVAYSSRNILLTPEDRKAAVILSQSLQAAQALIDAGERSVARLHQIVVDRLAEEPRAQVEAVDLVDAESLDAVSGELERPAVVLLTVRFGKVRLLDQQVLKF